ncbi:MAG: HEAT repeat domain-containing protein, partial [Gemmatimonadaceae bacterium]
SYLTIEQRGSIAEELRPLVGEWLYGCDVCQEVCPWNVRFARELPDDSPFAARDALGATDARTLASVLLRMSPTEFSASFKGSPMKRAKLRGLRRNAAVVLGNVGSTEDVPALLQMLSDSEPLVRGHVAWALGRIGAPVAMEPLLTRLSCEDDSWVAEELRSALSALVGERDAR